MSPAAPPPPSPAPPPRSRVVRAVGVVIRAATAAAILAAGWLLLLTYRSVFDDQTGGAPPARSDPREAAGLLPAGAADLLAGAWVVGDDTWAVGVRAVAADRVGAVFAEPARPAAAGPPTGLEADLLGWARSRLPRVSTPAGAEYAGLVEGIRVRVVTTGVGERVALAQAGWADDDGWTVVEVVPRPPGELAAAEAAAPLPPGAGVAAARVGPDGTVHAQLVRGAGPDDLAATWEAGGWAVTRTRDGPAGRRGGRTARAFPFSAGGPPLTLVTFTLDPGSAP